MTQQEQLEARVAEKIRLIIVDVLEIVGDEFAPKQEGGSEERKRLLGLIMQTVDIEKTSRAAITALIQEAVNEGWKQGYKKGWAARKHTTDTNEASEESEVQGEL